MWTSWTEILVIVYHLIRLILFQMTILIISFIY